MKEGSFDGAVCARKGREDGDGKNFPLLSPPLAYTQKRGGRRRKGEEIFPTTTSEASADFLTGPSSSSDVKKARRRQGSHKAVKYLKTAYSVVLHV